MQQHTIIGDRLCGELHSLLKVRPIVRHHHERLDGSGYPDRLRGDAIPLLAQIMGIVDMFDAMTSARSYRAALSFEDAAGEIRREAALGRCDSDLVAKFLERVEHRRPERQRRPRARRAQVGGSSSADQSATAL